MVPPLDNKYYILSEQGVTNLVYHYTYLLQQPGKSRDESKDAAVFDGALEIGVTMNTYTHLGLDDAKNEMIRMEELNQARKEIDKTEGKKPMRQNMFKVV